MIIGTEKEFFIVDVQPVKGLSNTVFDAAIMCWENLEEIIMYVRVIPFMDYLTLTLNQKPTVTKMTDRKRSTYFTLAPIPNVPTFALRADETILVKDTSPFGIALRDAVGKIANDGWYESVVSELRVRELMRLINEFWARASDDVQDIMIPAGVDLRGSFYILDRNGTIEMAVDRTNQDDCRMELFSYCSIKDMIAGTTVNVDHLIQYFTRLAKHKLNPHYGWGTLPDPFVLE